VTGMGSETRRIVVPDYPIVVRPLAAEDGGGWLAEAPDLPGCMTDGDTAEAALADMENAIAEWIDAAEQLGQPVPKPNSIEAYSGRWVQRVPKSLHMKLSATAKREGVSLNALVTSLLAEGIGQKQKVT